MDRINPPLPGWTVAASALHIGATALTATLMFLLAPAVSADELICEVLRDGSSQRYLIKIDDRRSTVTVTDAADSKQTYPLTVGELTPDRVQFAFNGMRTDAAKFVRQGKLVTMSLTVHADVLLDRSTNTLVEIGYVTDDKGEVLSLEDLKAMQAEEANWLLKSKGGLSYHPMFWLFLEVATYRYEGSCRVAQPHRGD
jgi:hypothetical protein